MSAPKALKATSLRDSLAKTVRLLTKQGIDVQFRGHQPYVQSRGDKVVKLVLPELNDSASPELIDALQGFLDHEVGHIFFTPFAKAGKWSNGNATRHALANIIEDIRLEKLLPRQLPGTKENLERMYDSIMDSFFGYVIEASKDPSLTPSQKFSSVMVVALRALAGQKAFQVFMDKNSLWPDFKPLLDKMPDISKRLRSLEDYKDVTSLAEDIIEALKNEMPEVDPAKQPCDEQDPDSEDGEGHGQGSGTDDEEGDEDDNQSCAGDADEDSDDEGEGSGPGEETDEDGDAASDGDEEDDEGGKDSDTPADNDKEGNPRSDKKDGRKSRTLRDALAMLEPTQRRALFLYNKRNKTVNEIAEDLNKSEGEIVDLLAAARKRLRDLLNGG